MRLQVGPVPSNSALAWIGYAREKIDEISSDPFAQAIADDVLSIFHGYLDEWTVVANAAPEFHWDVEIPSEVAEYQVHAFNQIAIRLSEAAADLGGPQQPPEAELFYQSLVNAIIDGLQVEGASTAEYATHLRSFWPGFGDSVGETGDAPA